jgi:hypothetical protein
LQEARKKARQGRQWQARQGKPVKPGRAQRMMRQGGAKQGDAKQSKEDW